MTSLPCPHCFTKYTDTIASPGRESGRRLLHPEQAINCLTRRNDAEYICGDCGKAEALADMCMPGHRPKVEQDVTDNMFRLVVYQDRCEGRRLPPGIPWGPSLTPTSGSVIGHDDPYDDKCQECDSLFAWGWACRECGAVRPAMKQLESHPFVVAREKALEEEAKREAQYLAERDHQLRIEKEVGEFIGDMSWNKKLCANCGDSEKMQRNDYICIRCRAHFDLAGNPLLSHVLQKLDQLAGK